MPLAGEKTNKETSKQASKQASEQASKRLGDAQTKPNANDLEEERGVEDWERQEKSGRSSHGGGRSAGRAKNGSGSEAAKWLSLYQDWEAGGRWQLLKVGTSAVLAVAGRVWAPDFYRVGGRTGPRNTTCLGAVTAACQGVLRTMTRLFLSI